MVKLCRKKKRNVNREHFMSFIQVVQGHGAQCTLVDCSLRIHRSFLFLDMVQAALPRGAWQSMTSPLFVCTLQRSPKLSATPAVCKPRGPPCQVSCLTLLACCVNYRKHLAFPQGWIGHHWICQYFCLPTFYWNNKGLITDTGVLLISFSGVLLIR